MIDFERGAKVTGSKFYFTIGEDAKRERDLINQMINYHTANGYQFILPPYLVNEKTATMAGLLPRFDGDYYKTTDGFMLIPTAETPLVGLHSNEIFKEEDLPIKYVAFSSCFRKEAGALGTRDKGLKRVHQFHKVELFVICKPEESDIIWHKTAWHVTHLLESLDNRLKIRMRILDEEEKSPVSKRTMDIEILCDNEWLEVSSISNTGDNQSKPAQIRYKPKSGGKNIKCHLINGSGVALPRLLYTLNWLDNENQ